MITKAFLLITHVNRQRHTTYRCLAGAGPILRTLASLIPPITAASEPSSDAIHWQARGSGQGRKATYAPVEALKLAVMVRLLVRLQWQPLGVAGRVHQAAHTAFCVFVRAFTGGGGDGPASTRARGSVVDVPVSPALLLSRLLSPRCCVLCCCIGFGRRYHRDDSR